MQGVRFECQRGCTKCCEVRGYIYVSEDDITRIAAFLGMPQQEFEAKYVVRFKRVMRLKKPLDAQCHFLTGQGCSIHAVKPTQCRLFPFWPELVKDRKAWNETGTWCPGIGKGELIQIGTACEVANQMAVAYPDMY